jgi:hypothetical protein
MLSLFFSGGPAVSLDHALDDLPLSAARDAALRGDWEPARAVLREAAGDWERRAHRCEVLGTAAADHPQWLAAWAAAEPESPDAAVVRARAGVAAAWNARDSGWARNTSAAAFDRFHRSLADAESAVVRATTLAAGDPSPWIWYLWLSIGRGDGRPVVERRWKELLARPPSPRCGTARRCAQKGPARPLTPAALRNGGARRHACPCGCVPVWVRARGRRVRGVVTLVG